MPERISGEAPFRRYPRIVTVPTPPAVTDWSVTVPSGRTWEIIEITAQLVTGAGATAREVDLTYSDGDTIYATLPPGSTQAATLTRRYSWFSEASPSAVGTGITQPIHDGVLLSGTIIASSTQSIVGTDAWSNIVLFVMETVFLRGADSIMRGPEPVVIVGVGGQ